MCAPDYFGVEYSINPWMTHNLGRVDPDKAKKQWHRLFETLSKFARVELLKPRPHAPDMVFTANAGLIRNDAFIPSHFQHLERRREETHFRKWFRMMGYRLKDLASPVRFEGEGDALFQPESNLLWMGYGFRTDLRSHDLLKKLFLLRVITLQLVDPRFYHLDTCFCPLSGNRVMYYPGAFSTDSLQSIRANIPAQNRIEIAEEDALHFACNAIAIENNLILNHASPGLIHRLQSLGYRVILNPVGEFLKSGGSNKCLALSLTHR
jgi:N-dimethylarginine dimethylaminohydrolase